MGRPIRFGFFDGFGKVEDLYNSQIECWGLGSGSGRSILAHACQY